MSKKTLIISILVLGLGSGLIPGGILIEDYINESVHNSIGDGLLGIEEEAIPLIEAMIKEKGIPQTLRGIRDIGIPILEDMVEVTFVAVLIDVFANTGGNISGTFYPPIGRERFFNNNTTGVWLIFSGVSQYTGVPLNFTLDAQNRILYGNSTIIQGYIPGIQGFLNDTSTGAGVANFIGQYVAANSSASIILNQTMQENYNCTWYQLSKLYEYVVDYLIELVIPLIISLNLHVEYMPALDGLLSVNAIAKALFMEQWANGTVLGDILYEGGIDFSEMLDEINETVVGFEVGVLNPSNISRETAYALFDEVAYPNALTNDTGFKNWIAAISNETIKNTLLNEFNLTLSQMDMILFWLFEESFMENIVPELMVLPPPEGVGMGISEYARVLLLEQWANGTVDGEVLYPYGFPLSLKAGVVYGFEVGFQNLHTMVIATNMSRTSAELLWDISNPYSLINGLDKWYTAVDNPESATAIGLQVANGLNEKAMEMILNWLPKFRDNVMPYLAQEDQNLPMDSTSLGNTIELGMVIPGGILLGLGVLGLVYNFIIRRKTELR